MDFIQELKSQVSIVDIVGRYRPLVKAGKNFKAVCPFHDDHKPSMMVNPVQNFAWCFACQNGGDIFSFVQKMEGIEFPEAVKIVGEIGGVDTSKFFSSQNPEKAKEKKEYAEILRDVLLETEKFFLAEFQKNSEAQKYVFEKRKFTEKTAQNFSLGYAPDDFHRLEQYLLEKKFSRKQMLDSGVVKTKDQNGETVYDTFRKRIMFSVHDAQGNICGFGGRILGEGDPKYMNSPQTALYDKSKILFGFDRARETIRKENMAVLVEGNLDVMTCHEFGITNSVGVSGVGFSVQQAKILKRFCTNVTLALDSDDAGLKASERILEVLLANGFCVYMTKIPGGKDPDESLREDSQKFIETLESAPLATDQLLEIYSKTIETSTASGKREICEKIFPMILHIQGGLEKKEAIEQLAIFLHSDSVLIEEELQKFKSRSYTHTKQNTSLPAQQKKKSELTIKEYFFGTLYAFPQVGKIIFDKIESDFFLDNEEKNLYESAKSAYNSSEAFCLSDLLKTSTAQMRENIQKASLYSQEKLSLLPRAQRRTEVERMVNQMGKSLLESNIKKYTQDLRTNPSAKTIENLQKFSVLLKGFH